MLEKNLGEKIMDLLDLMKNRRSIRKYQDKQISKEDLEKILEAGIYAPNAGGGQRGIAIACQNKELNEKIGKLNIGNFTRKNLAGSFVSSDQPSIIDDPSIKSGFYGAPTVVTIFGPKNFLYSIPDSYCMAENMVLEAYNLGINSCIIARGEETFESELGQEILNNWEIPENYIARVFVLLGYVDGPYPAPKPRKDGRYKIIE
jgi:nitroreductase